MKYCSQCATKLEAQLENRVWYCPSCKQHLYANPIPAIDALLADKDGRVLLGRRSVEPAKGKLNLPGGFVDMNETLEQAIERELKEELGISSGDYGELRFAGTRIEYHEQEGKRRQLISIIMAAPLLTTRQLYPSDDIEEIVWRLPTELTPEELTGKNEYDHITKAISKLSSIS